MHRVQGKAGTASSSSLQSTLSATDVGTKEIGLIESVCEDAESLWPLMLQRSISSTWTWLSTQEPTCSPKSYTTHATLEALLACWRGLDLPSASGKMLKFWGMREAVYNAMDLHGKAFTVGIPFVVCEGKTSVAVVGHVGRQGFPFDSQRWLPETWRSWSRD